MKTKHYFNTNRLNKASERLEASKNLRQEDTLYCIFKVEKKLTASEAWTHFAKRVPLTSIRRGMSNLMREGFLEKTTQTKIGIYGKPECYYKLSQTQIYE